MLKPTIPARPSQPQAPRPCVVRTRPDSNIFRGWGVSI